MEARDVMADIGWSMRPRAQRVPEASDLIAVVMALAVGLAVAIAAVSGTGSFQPAPGGAWAPIAIGLVAANVVALVAGWWSGRQVHPCRVVPLMFGLVFLAPLTLIFVELGASLVVHLWLRSDRPRRAICDAAGRVLEASAAIVVFHLVAWPTALNTPRTWGALLAAVLAAIVVREALDWSVRHDADIVDPGQQSLEVTVADGAAAVLGSVVGIGSLGLTVFDDRGIVLAIGGTTILMVGSLLAARTERRVCETSRLATIQAQVVDSLHDHKVTATAAQSVRDLVQADLAAIVGPEGRLTTATLDTVHEFDDSVTLAPLLEALPSGSGSMLALPDELLSLREATGLGEGPLHVLFVPITIGGGTWTVLAMREHAGSNPFTVAERRLIARATTPIASTLVAAESLARFERQARFDELTGLPSRVNIEDSIVAGVESSRTTGAEVAVLLVDLNGFKEVNDTLGHQTGDVVLAEIGRRIGAFADRVDAVGRLGGDEFVLLLSADDHHDLDARSLEISEGLAEAIAQPIAHGDLVLDIGISVGMARFPDHGESPGELIRAADVAMYAAKAKGVTFTAYEGKLDRHRSRRLGLATDLRAALADEQLEVFFQPKVSFLDGDLVGAEALIRWTHSTLRAIPAGEIIDIAEHAGLLRPLTDFVLDRAAAQVVQLRKAGCDIPIAVNLTERDIADTEFPERFRRVIDAHGLTPECISLEVTETALLTSEVEALGVLPRISEMGVTLAIDDFGTGFSSLSHLRKFPVDEIKIDMSFVERMVIRPNDAVIVRSIVELGHSLGLRVVAEGVETNEAWAMLEAFGTDVAQGNHVMKAIDAASFLLWAPFWDRHREQRGFLTHEGSRATAATGAVSELSEGPRTGTGG